MTRLWSGRPCPHCGVRVSRLADQCPQCGTKLESQRPWYVWALGGLIVALLFLALSDLRSLVRFAETLLGFFRGVQGQGL